MPCRTPPSHGRGRRAAASPAVPEVNPVFMVFRCSPPDEGNARGGRCGKATPGYRGVAKAVPAGATVRAIRNAAPSGGGALALAAAAAAGAAAGGLPARGGRRRVRVRAGCRLPPGSSRRWSSGSRGGRRIRPGRRRLTALPVAPRRGRCGRCGGRSFPARSAGRSCRRAARPECRARGRRRRWRPARRSVAVAELGHGAVALALALVAVDASRRRNPRPSELLRQLFRPVLGAAEDEGQLVADACSR